MEIPSDKIYPKPIYPKSAVTSANDNGIEVTGSSNYGTWYPWTAFNKDLGIPGWHSLVTYSHPTGDYNGSASFEDVSGEWIKIRFPTSTSFKLDRMELVARTGGFENRLPGEGSIFGSNDNTNWDLLKLFNQPEHESIKNITVSSTISYSQYTLVLSKLVGNSTYSQTDAANIMEIYLHG